MSQQPYMTTAPDSGSKFIWPDRLRNLATAMIILIHAASPTAHTVSTDYNGMWWWGANFWNALSRPGVPLFVMLSGYLLLSKDYELGLFLKKRFVRVVIPAVFWMLIYSFYNHLARGNPATLLDTLRGMVKGPVHYHLWFIYLIIGLYLVYPILRPWVRSASEREFLYFFVMCAVGTWVYKFMSYFWKLPIGIHFELFTNNCGYFVLGYYLGSKTPGSGPAFIRRRFLPGLLIVLGSGLTMFAAYAHNNYWGNDKAQTFFYDYLTPNVTITAIGWFLLAKSAFNAKPLLEIERDFATASFGIYFAHVLVMDWWGMSGYWHSMTLPWIAVPVLTILIVCMSFLAVSIIRVLPAGKRIT